MKSVFICIGICASLPACAAKPLRSVNAITPQSLPALQGAKLVDVVKYCEPFSRFYGCHGEVQKALELLMESGPIECRPVASGEARCRIGDLDVAEAMLLSGNATVRRGSIEPRYLRAEQIARRAKAGIWNSVAGSTIVSPPIEVIEKEHP